MRVQRRAPRHGEVMRLMMATLRHDPHEPQRADFLDLGRAAGRDR